ncbi:MAG TPA: tRNA (adenosine(37)-N6)-threonylcarbamoyltransferase complex ATPase subunit type 1 TsaE [Actinomycetota bacterium]|nr:tRNA (adenosine(37)-N6)-threonylcarbamoyltransferase complex ATPase subunit type 1 TsaE [Actinomycetota bacterium]
MRIGLRSPAAGDTRAIGAELAALLQPGDVIALTGELGAGKTTFTQGVARGLGFDGPVISPTFTLVREYRGGRMPVIHADVYRLDRVGDVLDLGLDEIADDGVLLVEWGDAVEGLLPPAHLVVELTVPGSDEERSVGIAAMGGRWALRWERLERALEPWVDAA